MRGKGTGNDRKNKNICELVKVLKKYIISQSMGYIHAALRGKSHSNLELVPCVTATAVLIVTHFSESKVRKRRFHTLSFKRSRGNRKLLYF